MLARRVSAPHLPSFPTRRSSDLAREAQRVTLIGAGVDLVVGVLKLVAGLVVGSAALVADAIHSFSDLVTDGFVLARSEEHTSELQSRGHLVCRLLLEKKKDNDHN